MKNTLALLTISLMLLCSNLSNAQVPKFPINESSKLIEYSEVIQTEGTKIELFNRCIEWINSYFSNPLGVTKIRDTQNGVIEGSHQFFVLNTLKDGTKVKDKLIKYNFTIQFKDGRYKYTITGFNIKAASHLPLETWLTKSPEFDNYLQQVDTFTKELIDSMKKGMVNKPKKQEEAW